MFAFMETLHRKHRDGVRSYPIWTQAEAEERGIRVVPWREAIQGAHTLSDDGYVSQCIARKRMGKVEVVLLPFGWFPVRSGVRCSWEERRESRAFGISPKGWRQVEVKKKRTKRAVKEYVKQFLEVEAGERAAIDWDAVGRVYRKDQKIPEATAKVLFRNPGVKAMVASELEKELAKEGVTRGRVVQLMNEALQVAREIQDPGTIFRVASKFGDMLDMQPDKALPSGPEVDFGKLLQEVPYVIEGAGALPGAGGGEGGAEKAGGEALPSSAGLSGDLYVPGGKSELPMD